MYEWYDYHTQRMTLIHELEKFNLSANEAKVYLACLELGPESIQHIASRAGMNRVSVYSLIESLIEKGFVHAEEVKNKRKFAAYPPTKLYDVVSKRQEQLKRQERSLDVLVPSLKKLANRGAAVDTNIIYYEGVEGLRNWASAVLEAKGEVLEWTRIESFANPFEEYLEQYYFPKKFKNKIPTRFIFVDTPAAHAYVEKRYVRNKHASPMKARFVPIEEFESFAFMVIYDNCFSIALPEENRAVTVVDPVIAESQRRIFEFGWRHAKGEVANGVYPLDVKIV